MDQLSKERLTIRVDEVDSTNLYLKRLAREEHPEEGSLVTAEYQTAGRGQMANSWFSTKGDNLMFSLLIYPEGGGGCRTVYYFPHRLPGGEEYPRSVH